MVLPVECLNEDEVLLGSELDNPACLVGVGGERLLQEDMLPRIQSLPGHFYMSSFH